MVNSISSHPFTFADTESGLSGVTPALYQKVSRRVTGQLLQTLLYEEVIPFRTEPSENGRCRFIVENGEGVMYRCYGLKSRSFDVIRLEYASLERISAQGEQSQPDFHQLLAELLPDTGEQAFLSRFISELEQTLIKDLQSRAQNYHPPGLPHLLDADALERHFMDAHSYHPCYKSRIGFSLQDNLAYGPEFAAPVHLVWLAIARSTGSMNHSSRLDFGALMRQEADEYIRKTLENTATAMGRSQEDYWLIPVHPWQWQQVILPVFSAELESGDVIYLGKSQDSYRAQQSIRTLANGSDTRRPYVKMSLSITNTSSTRLLARHTVMNGPIITDWLQSLIHSDATARELDFVILGEVAGVSFDYQHLPETRMSQAYGTLGALWRENIQTCLRPDEQAVPFNGLSDAGYPDEAGKTTPFIDVWINCYGLETWTQQLLKVTVLPVIHMLYAEGVGMESHGQNIILIVKEGWPVRVALKDFHDGVRYSPAHLARPELQPELVPLPASHARINRNSFILTEDVNAVRDFSCDCLFFICLTDIAIFLHQHYGMDESRFWQMTADIITDYQQRHPQHSTRFALFDVFAPFYEVEELTKRRLMGDGERRFKRVPNPLYPCRSSVC
ncbi:IucC [Klebsiella pneumoniae subsp. ozaenae]|uniref:IucC n=1 Tax=Klebsiella pneumoniae subsp. ozaenae TaxID=574 RepID=A0A378APK4_KLEPO|nr:IucC [Klebsiella pneumoniae subsp. ozaenae]